MANSAYTRWVSHVLFPLHERAKRHDTVAVRASLEQSQWWTPDRLRELQFVRLRRLLGHAEQYVPYYRDLFRRLGIHATDLRSISDLSQLPLLDKPLIRANVDRLKSERGGNLTQSNTGGSSGQPLIFFLGRERVSHDVAAKWRATRWWGVDIGDPEIVVWGSPIELGAQDRMRAWRDKMLRTELLPAFEMSEAKLDAYVERIRQVRPDMLFGYPSAISKIARHAQKRTIPMDGVGIKVTFVTSERLYEDQRDSITQVFGCPVANGYGGRDAGFIAHECPKGGMHITAEDVIIEVIDEQGRSVPAGISGEIVITHLASKDFPFVRYRTGDIGILDDSQCECGRGLPMLKDIEGRSTDFVVARDGTVMHGLALIYVLRNLPGIESFKVVQESLELTRVLVVAGEQFDQGVSDMIVEGLRKRLGLSVDVKVELHKKIPSERSGKFRYIVSHVAR
jgi:phenylacetate-CoA ligase